MKNRTINHKLKTKNYERGFSLLISIIIVAALLVATFAISRVASKQVEFSNSSRQSEYAFFAADAGVECALYWDSKTSPSKFDTMADGSPVTCNNQSISTGNSIVGTTTLAKIGGGGAGSPPTDVIWMEDSIPPGSVSKGDVFDWISSGPAPFAGSLSDQSNNFGIHQQYFDGASPTFSVNAGDSLIAYVYLDPANPPTEIMLQWNVTGSSWEHRAYWGGNTIPWGLPGVAHYYAGGLPTPGQWVRLEVPASQVGLAGQVVNGVAFTLDGASVNRAYWDHVGKMTPGTAGGSPTSNFGFSLANPATPTSACVVVSVTKNGNGTTDIFSRGYDTCDTANPRRVERGIQVNY